MRNPFESILHRLALRRWRRAARRAGRLGREDLRTLRGQARQVQAPLSRFLHIAEGRLAMPAESAAAFDLPLHCDWAYRPEPWNGPLEVPGLAEIASNTAIGTDLKVFHDCRASELSLHQVRNSHAGDRAPFGLVMEVFQFDGTFLSLVIELPKEAVHGLEKRHMIRLAIQADVERPVEIFARLNIKSGPNVEQVLRELSVNTGAEQAQSVEFDLAYSRINEKRVEQMWLDLIFEGAEMNRIALLDVALTRRPRAEM